MNIIEDIKPLSTFKQKAADVIAHVKATRRPMFITVNGNVEVVLQDAVSYQETLDAIEYLRNVQHLRKGLDEADGNLGIPADEAFAVFRKKHGLSAK